jgi:putative transposase
MLAIADAQQPREYLNRVFLLQRDGVPAYFRVVHIEPEFNFLALFEITMKAIDPQDATLRPDMKMTGCGPVVMQLTDFESLEPNQRVEVQVVLPGSTEKAVESLKRVGAKRGSKNTKEERKPGKRASDIEGLTVQEKKYKKRKALLDDAADPEGISRALRTGKWTAYVQGVARRHKVSRTAASRGLGRYFVCECNSHKATMFSLFGAARSQAQKKRTGNLGGRFPKQESTGHRLDIKRWKTQTSDVDKIAMFLKSVKDRGNKGFAELHRKFKETYETIPAGALDDGTLIPEPDRLSTIKRELFTHYVKQIESGKKRDVARIGRTKFAKDKSTHIGTARQLIPHPGHQYVIDSTVADIYLVSAFDRKLLIGRPTVYVVIDAFSSLILAVHVAMEDPCVEQASIALFQAMAPKDELFASLGLPDAVRAYLPQGCKCATILADRGEMLSKRAFSLLEGQNMALGLTAPYRADWKSLVERYFKVQNDAVLKWVPGGVRKRARDKERGDRDPAHDAVFTINGLKRLLLTLAAEWNATHDMSKHVSAVMLREEIEATPIGFWNWGLEALHGSPHFVTRMDAVREWLPALEAKVNKMGLQVLEEIRFTADWMREDEDFYDQRAVGRAQLIIDPDRPMTGFYISPQTDELKEVQLVDQRRYGEADVSLYDVRDTEAYMKLNAEEFEHDSEAMKRDFSAIRSKITRSESRLTNEQKGEDSRSMTSKRRSIKTNKAAAQRQVLGLPAVAQTQAEGPLPNTVDANDDFMNGLDDVFGEEALK